MEVTKVSANIRFSKEEKTGGWKTIELGAEATVVPGEDWVLCEQGLYSVLAGQLRTLWSQQNGHNLEHAQNGQEKTIEGTWEEITSYHPSPQPAVEPQLRAHWCPMHQTEFKKYEKDGRVWYSHKAGDSWCKEQKPMKMS